MAEILAKAKAKASKLKVNKSESNIIPTEIEMKKIVSENETKLSSDEENDQNRINRALFPTDDDNIDDKQMLLQNSETKYDSISSNKSKSAYLLNNHENSENFANETMDFSETENLLS